MVTTAGELTITVFGKEGCGKCVAACDKLQRMGFVFEYYTLLGAQSTPMARTALTLWAYLGESELPIIVIDDGIYDPIAFTYPEAMKVLKRVKKEGIYGIGKDR